MLGYTDFETHSVAAPVAVSLNQSLLYVWECGKLLVSCHSLGFVEFIEKL